MGHPRKKPIRGWRVFDLGEGVTVFCDPSRERLELYDAPWKDHPSVGRGRITTDVVSAAQATFGHQLEMFEEGERN